MDANACQALIGTLLGAGTIGFDTGNASISADSLGLLDHLVATLNRCPEAHVEIAGHADSTGSEEANPELSRQRAMAVAAYLERAGIAAANLTTAGYGSSRPVAANDTEANRARNRRIDFVVK